MVPLIRELVQHITSLEINTKIDGIKEKFGRVMI